MADTEAAPAPASSPKKAKSTKPKKPRTAPSHPKVGDMVNSAISNLKERGGSSLQAIKKYVASNYKVDVEKLSPFIKKYLKSAVASGSLVQTKGKGASGSFKLSSKDKPAKAAKKPVKAKKPAVEKKAAKPKKAAVKKVKKPVEKKVAKPKKAKTPKKEKKAKVQKKPKTPKPKKAAKKAAPKKK